MSSFRYLPVVFQFVSGAPVNTACGNRDPDAFTVLYINSKKEEVWLFDTPSEVAAKTAVSLVANNPFFMEYDPGRVELLLFLRDHPANPNGLPPWELAS